MKKHALNALFFIMVLISCEKKAAVKEIPLRSSSFNLKALADKIIERSKPQAGEKVFMIGRPNEFDSLIVFLKDGFAKSGAVYLGTINVDTAQWPVDWNTPLVQATKGKSREDIAKILDSLDLSLGIMLPGPTPDDAPYAAWQDVMRKGKGRAVHFHWAGANDMQGKGIPMDATTGKIYERVILETDYPSLSTMQEQFESAMRNEILTVTAPGTKLTFKIGDRPVTKQDGDASKERSMKARNLIDREVELPAGAIRVSPLEETVDGTIAIPDDKWGDDEVKGLVLTFKKGKIADISATEGADAVKKVLEPYKDKYLLRELGVGFNPLLAISDDNQRILHYGYGSGIVRLSLGNSAELGGLVDVDFVSIWLFPNATVTVGKDVWVKYGKVLKS
ncbi:MAG TPA: aminopeptidase [Cyclobacteriaceae bacterium]|nr:aminopeptidase [Cyclobacteriaceae bacterium]